jgi:hypothetical protein
MTMPSYGILTSLKERLESRKISRDEYDSFGEQVPLQIRKLNKHYAHRWCFHLVMVVGLVCTNDPESYAGGSVATGRASQAGQFKG